MGTYDIDVPVVSGLVTVEDFEANVNAQLAALAAAAAGRDLHVRDTLAELEAVSGPAEGDIGLVVLGTSSSERGVYRYASAAWARQAGFEYFAEFAAADAAASADAYRYRHEILGASETVFYVTDAWGAPLMSYDVDTDALSGAGFTIGAGQVVYGTDLDIRSVSFGAEMAMTDRFGFSMLYLDADTDELVGQDWHVGRTAKFGDMRIVPGSVYDAIQLQDDYGFVLSTTTDPVQSAAAEGYSAAEIAGFDAEALAVSRQGLAGALTTERLLPGYLHVISTGQSLSTGQEAWPALSGEAAAELDLYMVGDSPRPRGKTTEEWVQLGTLALNPLKAVVQTSDFSALLSPAAVAALSPGENVPGEQVEHAALETLKTVMLDRLQASRDATRKLILTACGVGGARVTELSDGASPDYWARIEDAIALVEGLATGAAEDYRVPAVTYLQGEADLNDASSYKTDLGAYLDDLQAAIAAASGQTRPAAIFLYQTRHTAASQDVGVGQAQLELALERSDTYLAAPVYAVTDKGVHLDPNGSRWLGCHFGKVMARVLLEGQAWKPLHCVSAVRRGREILLGFHVPVPPLAWRSVYDELTATDIANKGFAVYDDGVAASISTVEIVGAATVRIVLTDEPSGAVTVTYADGGGGRDHGNLADSDDFVAPLNYLYSAGTGQYAGADIAALKDKPYPMQNFCVAFIQTVTEE